MAADGLTRSVLRGQIWWADLNLGENKRILIVSNNQRNARLPSVIGLYVTSNTNKPDLPSVARFEPGEVGDVHSLVLGDDPWVVERKHLDRIIGALTPGQMLRVESAIKAAFDLT